MSFYLGVWKSLTAISDDEAAGEYRVLSEGKSAPAGFDNQVYAFYSRLTDLYPEIDLLPEAELDASPWACAIDMSGSHVIMAILPEKTESVVPKVLALAEQHELVCFDPHAGKVYLPPHLRARQSGAAGA